MGDTQSRGAEVQRGRGEKGGCSFRTPHSEFRIWRGVPRKRQVCRVWWVVCRKGQERDQIVERRTANCERKAKVVPPRSRRG